MSGRLLKLERRVAPGAWVGYPSPVFSDEHMAEAIAVLVQAMGADALLADFAARVGGPVPAELEAYIRECAEGEA